MRKRIPRNYTLVTLTCCLLLAGCSERWVKTRGNAADYLTARSGCDTRAREAFPVRNEVAQRTKYTTHYEKCGKKAECDGEKWKAVKKPEIESYVMDVNGDSRAETFYQCMTDSGWETQIKWF